MKLGPSELILNADGSIYHLNILPEDIADTIITVGDPERVNAVSCHFDSVEVKKGKREFHTHTGTLNGKRLTVISTGIGTDNIDIVLNELDALVNIDFKSRTVKPQHTALQIIRIGTSGALQAEIPIGSFLLSEFAMGFDNLLHFYKSKQVQFPAISQAFMEYTNWSIGKSNPYVVKYDQKLGSIFQSDQVRLGMTVTNPGFYGPQGRTLRLAVEDNTLNEKLATFEYKGLKITNLEMETSGIYGLSTLLGHQAVSLNCILANRATGEFSETPGKAVEQLITFTLDKLTGN